MKDVKEREGGRPKRTTSDGFGVCIGVQFKMRTSVRIVEPNIALSDPIGGQTCALLHSGCRGELYWDRLGITKRGHDDIG